MEIVDGKISFEFSVDIDPAKLDEQKTKIKKDFVEKIDEEIETNIRKGGRKKSNCKLISSEECHSIPSDNHTNHY